VRNDLSKDLLYLRGNGWVEIGGEPEIVRGFAETGVSEIRLEKGQVGREVLALLDPSTQAMNGMGVTEIMNPGAFARPPVGNAGVPEKRSEIRVYFR